MQAGSFFNNLSIPTINLWPDMSMAERTRAIKNFNDPNHPSRVMIYSMRATAYGVNLQKCSRVLIFSYPDNVNIIIQVISRVHRIG